MNSGKGFDMELFFSALADRTRLRLLNLMSDGEMCVCFFAETLDTNNPKISRHLAYLKRAGLVKARRDGKWMHYSLTPLEDKHASRLLGDLLLAFQDDRQMRLDKNRLKAACCSPTAPVTIQRLVGAASK